MGKNKKCLEPRRKRMDRNARLQNACDTNWIQNYEGNDLACGYRRWYGANALTAVMELRQLGVSNLKKREAQIRQELATRKPLKNKANIPTSTGSDDTFAFIAGYTSGGAPYGVTWEEMSETPQGFRNPTPSDNHLLTDDNGEIPF